MANLDKLLRKIEQNKETENATKVYQLEIGGETFDVRTMTRKERREFIYAQDANSDKISADDLVKKMKPFIYKALNLAQLAEKAKDEGYIKSYYDVIDALFEATSALATVGLTAGVTPLLGAPAQILLIIFMYFGRVGILTLSMGFLTANKAEERIRYADTNLLIG